jgi:hypothetical protein
MLGDDDRPTGQEARAHRDATRRADLYLLTGRYVAPATTQACRALIR